MSDLISRSALFKQLKEENIPFNADINEIINIQPVAYDKEAVIKQMQEYAECNDNCKSKFYYGQGCNACAFGKMIDFVKAGGVND